MIVVFAHIASGQHVRPRVKAGLWEQTITLTRQGAPPISDRVLSNLTPEQRARVEAQMRANQQPRTTTHQACLTDKDLDSFRIFENSDPGCKETIRTSTGTEVDEQWECKMDDGITGKGTLHIDILSPESARGTVHMIADENGHHLVTDSRMTARWLGPDCSKMHE